LKVWTKLVESQLNCASTKPVVVIAGFYFSRPLILSDMY